MAFKTLVHIMLALVTAESLHALSEMFSAQFKVRQLAAWADRQPAPTMPVNVDTRPKAYAVLLTVAAVLIGVSFAIFTALALPPRTEVIYVIVLVSATYAITGLGLDRFHVAIAAVGRKIRALTGAES